MRDATQLFVSVIGFCKTEDCDGIAFSTMQLDDGHRDRLMTEVGSASMTAGATAQQIQLPDQSHETLRQHAEQDSVRNGVRRACVNSLRE